MFNQFNSHPDSPDPKLRVSELLLSRFWPEWMAGRFTTENKRVLVRRISRALAQESGAEFYREGDDRD
jgi:chemotaxis regulatin CheY-phosphate phosphatase CheZ